MLPSLENFPLLQELLEITKHHCDVAFSEYHDNIGSQNFHAKLCSSLPIDAVYTWVNGSEPELLSQLSMYKAKLNMDLPNETSSSSPLESSYCNLDNCFYLPMLLIYPNHTYDFNNISSTFTMRFGKGVLNTSAINMTLAR